MASYCILEEFEVTKNKRFLQIAQDLEPKLHEETVMPDMPEKPVLKKDDTIMYDFGSHYVGYVTLDLSSSGRHPDAPVYLYFKFVERMDEMETTIEEYKGRLSKSWIQEEYVHVDVLPCRLELPRRYAFRYMQLKVIDVSPKFSLVVEHISMRTVSAANFADVPAFGEAQATQLDKQIDAVGVRTLHNCMQKVFEDGPKRDRRIWLGDFRLQARANYETFKNYGLVKRCLYLFGGMTFNGGHVPACLFIEPEMEPDDTYLFDYALLYGSVLLDYYEETKDKDTLTDLYPVAIRQIEIGMGYLNEDGVIPDHSGEFWCFVDWGDNLNTQAASLAILIYAMRYGIRLANHMGDEACAAWLSAEIERLKKKAIEHFWDEKQQFFVSGANRQVSWATQVWMILARIFPMEQNRELILRTIAVNPEVRMATPYMYHHYIDALMRSGEKGRALDEIRRYWGGMIRDGADTFWEVYNPDNRSESPYGSAAINSYCHAWSCTPSYFFRKFWNR